MVALAADGVDPVHLAAAAAEAIARIADCSFREGNARSFALFSELDAPSFEGLVDRLCAVRYNSDPADPDAWLRAVALAGRAYELALHPDTRRQRGAHFTGVELAQRLTSEALSTWTGPAVPRVLDPCCGGGAFLIAAVSGLIARSAHADHRELAAACAGRDIDPDAVAIAQATLALWAAPHTGKLEPLGDFAVADALLAPLPAAEVVVGNPPFLNQLAGDTNRSAERHEAARTRFGDAVGPYSDEAGLILLAGLDAMTSDGLLTMIQPLSLLGTRDSGGIRSALSEQGHVEGLWVCEERVFDAAVAVCAPVVHGPEAATVGLGAADSMRRWSGPDVEPATASSPPGPGDSWSFIGSALAGIPALRRTDLMAPSGDTVGDAATVTAGFRDQFYGFRPHVREARPSTAADAARRRLMTVGMLDPLRSRWGTRPFAFSGQRYTVPEVDLDEVTAENEALGRWCAARSVPKVLVATQTRVIEAWVDVAGDTMPVTPVISIEPHTEDAAAIGDLWLLAALLSSPPIAAVACTEQFGTARSVKALKVSARFVASLPLPDRSEVWHEGAALAEQSAVAAEAGEQAEWMAHLHALGEVMVGAWTSPAVQQSAPELLAWWLDLLPPWR